MSSNPKRKRYIWFDDDTNSKDEEYTEDNYSEDVFEEERGIKFRSNREIKVNKALKMLHMIKNSDHNLTDIIEYPESIIVVVEMHGVKNQDIVLTIVEQKLLIRFKHYETPNIHAIQLSTSVDSKPIQSIYKNGVLFLELKKSKQSKGTFTLQINNI